MIYQKNFWITVWEKCMLNMDFKVYYLTNFFLIISSYSFYNTYNKIYLYGNNFVKQFKINSKLLFLKRFSSIIPIHWSKRQKASLLHLHIQFNILVSFDNPRAITKDYFALRL